MPFFARPNLENTQFKQLSGSTLTLSGTTQIAQLGGLEFIDENGTYIPVVITGATDTKVLTYYDGKLILMSGGTGSTGLLYPYIESATTTVGGLPSGQNLYGEQVVDILHDILVPTLNPTLTAPSSTFILSPSTTIFETGCQIVFTSTSTFNQGCICPQYTATCDKRSNCANSYRYINFTGGSIIVPSTLNSDIYVMPSRTITAGSNSVSGNVGYDAGVQPKNSAGGNYGSPLLTGTTASISRTVTGIYPWFWGTTGTTPTTGQTLINSYTCKCVASSSGAITVTNFNVTDEYIWFAIPFASASKTCWQGANNPSNNGVIPGGLFLAATCVNIISPDIPTCWGSTCYKIYVSSYKTSINYGMTFCN